MLTRGVVCHCCSPRAGAPSARGSWVQLMGASGRTQGKYEYELDHRLAIALFPILSTSRTLPERKWFILYGSGLSLSSLST